MSLSAQLRLRHRREFSAVYRNGKRYRGTVMALRSLYCPAAAISSLSRSPIAPSRIGISVSQKVSKRAVIRNRIKRQIKAAFRQLLPRISPGWWLVVVVNPNAVQCEYEQFLRELEQLLTNAEVIDGHS